MQNSARSSLLIETDCLCPHSVSVEVGKCIQTRIQPLDLLNVGLGQFNYRKLAGVLKF